METKKDIRKRVLKIRDNISKTEWEAWSNRIYEKIVTHSFFLESEFIYCFINYSNEVDTRRIIEKAWELGKTVAVPKIHDNDMYFHVIHGFDELEEGYKGILEPMTPKFTGVKDGLMIMPGVAFDKNKNRIGYGKGFYDRFLDKYPQLSTIAIAFDFQVVEQIPFDEHDWNPQILITEEHTYV